MSESDRTVQGSMFEGLFERRLKPQGAFLRELNDAGYDPAHPEPLYSEDVLIRCVEIARRHVFPDLSPKDGEFRVGQELGDSFLIDTLAGKVLAAAMPLVGPDRIVKTLPRRFKSGSDAIIPEVEHLGERHWKVTLGHNPTPYMVAGAVHAALTKTGVSPKVVVERIHPSCVLSITWEPKAGS